MAQSKSASSLTLRGIAMVLAGHRPATNQGLLNTAPCGRAVPFQPSGQVRVKSMDDGCSVSCPVRRSIVAKRTRVWSAP